jgi:phosphate transport system permease protein
VTTTTPPAGPESRHADGAPAAADTRLGDRVFRALTGGAGVTLLLLIVAIAAFLIIKALPALRADSASFLTQRQWLPDGEKPVFGIAALALGSVVTSLLALLMGVPIALAAALFITDVAPRRLAALLGSLLDLLAAVPSVVYGLWGFLYLVPRMSGLQLWLGDHLGFIPIFHNPARVVGRSIFAASVVLAIMIIPIVAAISREIFLTVPTGDREAAMALGATRWESLRLAVLPYSRSGIIGAAMLGLGRALGETIAVALVISASFDVSSNVLKPGGNSIAANIATQFGSAETVGRGALIASGLVLFVITLLINMVARAIVTRGESKRVRV